MSTKQELLWDLVESEADVVIFFDRNKDNFKAKGGAIIITGSPIGHFPKKRSDQFSVWFGRGIERWTFKKFKDAVIHVHGMLKKVKDSAGITFRFEGKQKKKFEKLMAKLEVSK